MILIVMLSRFLLQVIRLPAQVREDSSLLVCAGKPDFKLTYLPLRIQLCRRRLHHCHAKRAPRVRPSKRTPKNAAQVSPVRKSTYLIINALIKIGLRIVASTYLGWVVAVDRGLEYQYERRRCAHHRGDRDCQRREPFQFLKSNKPGAQQTCLEIDSEGNK